MAQPTSSTPLHALATAATAAGIKACHHMLCITLHCAHSTCCGGQSRHGLETNLTSTHIGHHPALDTSTLWQGLGAWGHGSMGPRPCLQQLSWAPLLRCTLPRLLDLERARHPPLTLAGLPLPACLAPLPATTADLPLLLPAAGGPVAAAVRRVGHGRAAPAGSCPCCSSCSCPCCPRHTHLLTRLHIITT
jgi:hypothetical protein